MGRKGSFLADKIDIEFKRKKQWEEAKKRREERKQNKK